MSEPIRHTLINHEVTPPPAVWDKILTELNELDPLKTVGQKLSIAEVVPSPQNWNSILSRLEEDSIIHKLETYEQVPPASAWKKITSGLDAADQQSGTRKISPWWRYAAAAAILVAIGLGILRLSQPGLNTEETARHQDSIPSSSPANQDLSKEVLEELVAAAPVENDEARNDAALEASKKTYARLEYPAKKIAREVSGFYFNAYPAGSGTQLVNSTNQHQPEPNQADRYITLMTPEGNIIRVSKKLSGMVCCISGEADDPACTDQLKKWREKIVASSLGHSADSFMDLLLLINSAEENQPY